MVIFVRKLCKRLACLNEDALLHNPNLKSCFELLALNSYAFERDYALEERRDEFIIVCGQKVWDF